MEIGNQIKKYRTEMKLSQDDLAEKIYVTRQTISNWENHRNYPDIRSLVLLGQVFGISLDILIKGDLEQMNEEIKTEDIQKWKRDSRIYAIMLVGMMVLPMPLVRYLRIWGILVWLVWAGISIWWALRLEKSKKTHDIHTYREIVAFMNGKRLDELEKNQEIGKRPYQTALLIVATAIIAFGVVFFLRGILFHF